MSGVRIVYLGKLADVAGQASSALASSSRSFDWEALVEALRNHVNSAIAEAACDRGVKIALNGVIVPDRSLIVARHGDEVALLPPVSGG